MNGKTHLSQSLSCIAGVGVRQGHSRCFFLFGARTASNLGELFMRSACSTSPMLHVLDDLWRITTTHAFTGSAAMCVLFHSEYISNLCTTHWCTSQKSPADSSTRTSIHGDVDAALRTEQRWAACTASGLVRTWQDARHNYTLVLSTSICTTDADIAHDFHTLWNRLHITNLNNILRCVIAFTIRNFTCRLETISIIWFDCSQTRAMNIVLTDPKISISVMDLLLMQMWPS